MKKVIEIILYLLFLASFLNMIKVLQSNYLPDFNVYYSSATFALHGGNPYLFEGAFTGGFLYPPFCLLLFYPFTLLTILIASKLWTVISILCLLLATWLLLRLYNSDKNNIMVVVAGILVFNYFPVKFTLGMGQINILILLLIVCALFFFKKNNNKQTSFFFTLSLMIKYFPLILIPYLLIRKQWNIVTKICLIGVVLAIIGFISLGPSSNIYYLLHTIPSLSTESNGSYYYNQALSGFLQRDFGYLSFFQLNVIRAVLSLLFLIITAWILIKRKIKNYNPNLEIGIVITLSLLLSSFSWQHHFVLLLIPLIVTYFVIKQHKLTWYFYVILAICYLLTASNASNPSQLPIVLQSHIFYGALILWILDLYLLYRF